MRKHKKNLFKVESDYLAFYGSALKIIMRYMLK